jgi:hypothetical protein
LSVSFSRIHQSCKLDEEISALFVEAPLFDQLQASASQLEIGFGHFLKKNLYVDQILGAARENLQRHEMAGLRDRDEHIRDDLQRFRQGDDVSLDSAGTQQDIDDGTVVLFIERRREEADPQEVAAFSPQHRLLGVIPVPSEESQAAHYVIRFGLPGDREDDVQVMSGAGFAPEDHGKAPDESPSYTQAPKVRAQPDQGFLKTSHEGLTSITSRRRWNPGVGTPLYPGCKAFSDFVLARLRMLPAKLLPHDVLDGLAKVERRSGASQNLGIADRFHDALLYLGPGASASGFRLWLAYTGWLR